LRGANTTIFIVQKAVKNCTKEGMNTALLVVQKEMKIYSQNYPQHTQKEEWSYSIYSTIGYQQKIVLLLWILFFFILQIIINKDTHLHQKVEIVETKVNFEHTINKH